MITLDLNHFGFRGRGGQRKRKDKRRKDEGRRREPRSRANLNGGELNGEGLKYPKGVSNLRQIKQRSAHAASGNVGRISWNRRVLQARANLNGGELDEGLPSDHIKKEEERWCTPSDRPK